MLAIQASTQTISPCEKLLGAFASNEVTYTMIDDTNQSLLASEKKFAEATKDFSLWESRLREMAADREEFSKKGDRLVTLLSGHGCPLPDHVASPETFRADLRSCEAAKGTEGETKACDYIARTVAASMAEKAKPAKTTRLKKR